ncbi:MAG TPA: M4 family metallopeptidase, partial [Bacteroidia bacterium]|nr:M4 family metallopeptidase [Bacteroidia bacterium]
MFVPIAAQQPQASAAGTTLRSDENGSPRFISFAATRQPLVSNLPTVLRESFPLISGDDFQFVKQDRDQIGMVHQTYQQVRNGIPVFGGVVKAHCKGDHIMSLSGRFVRSIQTGNAVLDSETALAMAISHTGAQRFMWEMEGQDSYLQRIKNDPAATWRPKGELWYVRDEVGGSQSYRLAWKFDIYSVEPLFRADVYVDANSGAILFRNDVLSTADANGIGHSRYSGVRPIVTDSVDATTFRLRESGRAMGVETFNMLNGTDYNSAVDFTDSNNVWDTFAVPFDNSAIDAHWGAEMTYDYFWQKHGRDSYDDAASKLISYVHYDNSYSNAFWNGIFMTYGDGGNNNNPFQGLDVCGHEFAHGVTQYTAGLIYQNESGALNESFSDIFGNTIEFWARPNDASWRIGDDIGAFRSMSSPNIYSNPDTYKGSFWATGSWDNGGVHTNSGVQNFWYYLLSEGGAGTNDNGDNYSVTGIGIDSAAAIAYRNLSVYLSPNDGYAEARYYSIHAAADLFGECSQQMIQTMNAWHAVGVGLPYTGTLAADFYTPDTNLCTSPSTVHFTNRSTSALGYLWDFGDGATSTDENPSHTYTFLGSYTVRLIAYGCNGAIDTLVFPDRIIIDLNQPCNVNMPSGSDTLLQSACEGNLYDSGGSGDYLDNSNSRVTINPGGNNQVQLV